MHVTNKSSNDDHKQYDEDAQNIDFDSFEFYEQTFKQVGTHLTPTSALRISRLNTYGK